MLRNTVEENWSEWAKPTVYKNSHPSSLPYPDIVDNTEGIAGFHDLPIPNEPAILLDIGGGKSDSGKHWLNMKYPSLVVHVVDPFARSAEHNRSAQEEIEAVGGADIATSISVLNVIQDLNARIAHIVTVHDALKKGGLAFFKVWAGSWPVRGTGKGELDTDRNVFQANAWASAFKDEIAVVFGCDNVYADNNSNMVVAKRQADITH